MGFRNIFILLCVSLLLMGAVSAQKNINDFQIDKSYYSAYYGTYDSLYLNEKQDSGITIYKYLIGNAADGNDAYDYLIHDEGRDYLIPDDNLKLDKNSDNTANFTDYDLAQHGVVEVINVDDEDFVIVFWAKDTCNVSNSDLISQLNKFNKENHVEAIAF